MGLFSNSNSKMGQTIWTFSIPAVQTCPGSTPTCRHHCYANKSRFKWANVKQRFLNNVRLTRTDDFVTQAVAEIKEKGITLLRIHAAGDFYSADYVNKWREIMRACPETTFYAYTRSWRIERIRPALDEAVKQKNFHLWFSADKDTGVPPKLPNKRTRVAWMQTALDDLPAKPVPLVFRTHNLRKHAAADAQGSPICPPETGLPGAKEVTCGTCTKCWSPAPKTNSRRVALAVI